MSSVTRRSIWIALAALAALAIVFVGWRLLAGAPPDTQPEGAYVRVAERISAADARGVFTLLDDDGKSACERLWRARREASTLVESTYPEPRADRPLDLGAERAQLLESYRPIADAEDPAAVWVVLAAQRSWIAILRRDLSGVTKVDLDGDMAVIHTARGTQYPFAKRANGTWGLSLFTTELVADAWRAERDLEVIRSASADYARVPPPPPSSSSR